MFSSCLSALYQVNRSHVQQRGSNTGTVALESETCCSQLRLVAVVSQLRESCLLVLLASVLRCVVSGECSHQYITFHVV